MTGWGIIACVAGLGIIVFNANETILATGGYYQDHAPLIMATAVALAFGACCIGMAKADGRRGVFWALILTIGALEAWTVLTTGERIVVQRDNASLPARLLVAKRHEAEKRLEAARDAVPTTTHRLEAAMLAKAKADEGVITEAAKKNCVSVCRQLLTKAVDDAAAELSAARAELGTMKAAALSKVTAAESALAGLPAPKSETPFADRLGLPGWGLDLIMAMLKSLGVNGFGAALMAFGAHAHRRPVITIDEQRDPHREADRFARAMFRPATNARVSLHDIRESYHAWCREQGIEPLANQEIGAALSALFSTVGLTFDAGAVVGIDWARKVPALRAA